MSGVLSAFLGLLAFGAVVCLHFPQLTDIVYFLSTHLPIQITTFLILLPAIQLTSILNLPAIPKLVSHLPWIVQFGLAVVVGCPLLGRCND